MAYRDANFYDKAKGFFNRMFGDPSRFFGKSAKSETFTFGEIDIPKKLMKAVKKSQRDMEPYRKAHHDGVVEYMNRIGQDNRRAVPVNKIRQMTRIYMRLLSSETPQAMVETDYPELRAFAETFKLALNRHLREIRLNDAVHSAVFNALFSVGCIKTGLADGGDSFEYEGAYYDPGMAFSTSVHINHLVVDMEADSPHELSFIGDRFKRPTAWIDAMKRGDKESAIESLQQSEMQPEEHPLCITDSSEDRLYSEGWCWDIYLPKQNLMCLFAEGCDTPLDVYEWDGPEGGPYTLIGFDWPDGVALPAPPVDAIAPLHNFVNALVCKLENQARRQKTLGIYEAQNDEDAKRLQDASDGEIVGVTSPDSIGEMKLGGADPGNHNMTIWVDQMFDILAGGLDVLGGTEAQSETLGQDKLLHDSASVLIDDMRRIVREALGRVIQAHAWYLWTEPIRDMTVHKTIPGTDIHIPVQFSPEVREGDFIQYNIHLNPHSLRETTPQERVQTIVQTWQNFVMPNMPLYQQAGMMPNVVEMTKQVFELQNVNTADFFIPIDPAMQQELQSPGQIPLPAQFKQSRTVNERVSRPGTTRKGNAQSMMAANAGLAPQNEQAARFSRAG